LSKKVACKTNSSSHFNRTTMSNENDINKIKTLKIEIQAEKEKYDSALKDHKIEFWELKIIRQKIKRLRTSLRVYIQKVVKNIHKTI